MRLVALCRHGECSVSDLTHVISLSQPRVSQQLKQLCDAGILQRFRDGKWVFYRVPARGADASTRRILLELIPDDDPVFRKDLARLQALRGERLAITTSADGSDGPGDRELYKALVELTVTTHLGDLLDVGCGRGQILKLLASRAHRAVGVDIDSDSRRLARSELMLAGLPNCSLRSGDMYQLPFGDSEFDTIILDDVLGEAKHPVRVLTEVRRLLRPRGRLIVLHSVGERSPRDMQTQMAAWSAAAGLHQAPARLAPTTDPHWILAVATLADSQTAAA